MTDDAPAAANLADAVTAHLAAQDQMTAALTGMPQNQVLALVADALNDPAMRKQLTILRAAGSVVQDPMIRQNVQTLSDLAALTPVAIAQAQIRLAAAAAAAVAEAAKPPADAAE